MLDMEVVRNLDVLTAKHPGTASCTQGCRFVGEARRSAVNLAAASQETAGSQRQCRFQPCSVAVLTQACNCAYTNRAHLQLRLKVGDNGDIGAGVTCHSIYNFACCFLYSNKQTCFLSSNKQTCIVSTESGARAQGWHSTGTGGWPTAVTAVTDCQPRLKSAVSCGWVARISFYRCSCRPSLWI